MGTASYLSGSRPRITDAAEASETSCSPERPPKTTPTRSLFLMAVIDSRLQSCVRSLKNLFAEAREDQLDPKQRGCVVLINYGIYFDELEGNHALAIGNHF